MASEHDILNELRELNSPLAGYSRAMPHHVPEGYFEELGISITKTISGNATPFDVPANYFDNLPNQLLQQVKQQDVEQQTVKHAGSKRIWLNIRRATVAAILVIAIGIGTYRIFNNGTPGIEEQLSAIPDADLLAYVQENMYDFETEVIISNLNNTETMNMQTTDLSDSTIEQYLEQTGWE